MAGTSRNLERCLEDIESRIDPATEDALLREWVEFTRGNFKGAVFCPARLKKAPPAVPWPETTVNGAIAVFDQMALRQFSACSGNLAAGDGAVMAVRSSYGTPIVPSLFGVELFFMVDGQNTLPGSKPLSGGREAIKALVKKGVPDLDGGLGARVFEMGRRFAAIFRQYPKIGKYVRLYHPDLQGPLDICEMLLGSDLFIDIVDEPALVKDFLALITETYIAFMNRWIEIAPFGKEYNVHWNMLHRGSIMLRIDSGMNISPEMYSEFSVPYDRRLLDIYGGGGIHFCGRGDHYIARLAAMRGVHAVAMSQPHLNDMEKIFSHTVDKGIKLLGFSRKAADQALAAGRSLRGNVHCWPNS